MVEKHPFEFFLPANGRVLMLGSFPPPHIRWSMDFFYPNLQNDMWRIFGLLFFSDKDYFVDLERKCFKEALIKQFLSEHGFALGDTATEVIRQKANASDQFLEIVKPIDLGCVLAAMPNCRFVATTGQKATETILTLIDARMPKIGESSAFCFQGRDMRLFRMPSSSRAYPLALERKASYYGSAFREMGIL